jgi:hypothetical protein
MKFRFALCAVILACPLFAAATPTDEAVSALKAQMTAWNNQDMDGALSYYWNSEGMTWVNRKGISFGIAEFAKSMQSDFADKSKMGHYDGKVLHSSELSPELVLLVLDWKIVNGEGKRMMGGISTQLWRKTASGWKVVFEHAS